MKNIAKRLPMAVALTAFVLLPASVTAETSPYSDVLTNNAHYDGIMHMTEENYISGFPDNTYRTWENINRGQVATILTDAADISIPDNVGEIVQQYDDVHVNSDYAKEIAAVTNAGIFQGYQDDEFGTWGNLTRQQMATVLVEAFNLNDIETASSDRSFNTAAIKTIADLDVTSAKDNFKPYQYVNRGQMATFTNESMKAVQEAEENENEDNESDDESESEDENSEDNTDDSGSNESESGDNNNESDESDNNNSEEESDDNQNNESDESDDNNSESDQPAEEPDDDESDDNTGNNGSNEDGEGNQESDNNEPDNEENDDNNSNDRPDGPVTSPDDPDDPQEDNDNEGSNEPDDEVEKQEPTADFNPYDQPMPDKSQSPKQEQYREDMLSIIKEERQAYNDTNYDLERDPTLDKIASLRAKDLNEHHVGSHDTPSYGKLRPLHYNWQSLYPNKDFTVKGLSETLNDSLYNAENDMSLLMASTSHKSIMMNKNADKVGIGVHGDDGKTQTIMIFASTTDDDKEKIE